MTFFFIHAAITTAIPTRKDSWDNESGWESEAWSKSDSDSNVSWSSSSPQQKPLVQNEASAQPSSRKAPAGINVTQSTLSKTNLLGTAATNEGKPSSQVPVKSKHESYDIFASMGLSADIRKTAHSDHSSFNKPIKPDSSKSSLGWQSAVVANNSRDSMVAASRSGVPVHAPSENDIKSSWGDADDELAALLEDD